MHPSQIGPTRSRRGGIIERPLPSGSGSAITASRTAKSTATCRRRGAIGSRPLTNPQEQPMVQQLGRTAARLVQSPQHLSNTHATSQTALAIAAKHARLLLGSSRTGEANDPEVY